MSAWAFMRFHYNFPPCMIDLTNTMGDKSSCCYVVAIDAINIAELAYTEFTCYTFIADEVMLGKAVLYHSDHRIGINSVIFRFVELRCKSNAKYTYLFCWGVDLKSVMPLGIETVILHQCAIILAPYICLCIVTFSEHSSSNPLFWL